MADSATPPDVHSETPYGRARSGAARRLSLSVTTKPRVTLHSSARIERLLSLLEARRAVGPHRLRLTHFLARVSAHVFAAKPVLNGWVQDEVITRSSVANLGLAVQTERALVTPVLPGADRLPFEEFVVRLEDLIDRARKGKLHPRELMNATFTLSNLGASRIHHFTPIVSPPQLAILGVGRAETVPHWDGSTWQPVPEVPLSLTFDHAAVDGQPAASFLDELLAAIENPPDAIWR